jgi:DNA-binding transcriptional MerR regulator
MKTATISEIAREKGVTRQALEYFRNENNIKPSGKCGNTDLYHVSDFANFGKSKKDKSEWQLRWEKARAEKLELENAKKRGELLDRAMAAQVFSGIYQIHRSIILNIGPSLSDIITAEAGIKEPDKALKIQELIDNECYQALDTVSKDRF